MIFFLRFLRLKLCNQLCHPTMLLTLYRRIQCLQPFQLVQRMPDFGLDALEGQLTDVG
jgi:hypothetical protein